MDNLQWSVPARKGRHHCKKLSVAKEEYVQGIEETNSHDLAYNSDKISPVLVQVIPKIFQYSL